MANIRNWTKAVPLLAMQVVVSDLRCSNCKGTGGGGSQRILRPGVDCSSVLHEPTLRRKPTSAKQGEPKAEPGPRITGQPPPAWIARRLPVVLEWTIVVSPQTKPSREVPSGGGGCPPLSAVAVTSRES